MRLHFFNAAVIANSKMDYFREGEEEGSACKSAIIVTTRLLIMHAKKRNCKRLTICYWQLRYSLFLHLSGRCENGKDLSVLAGVPYTPRRAPFRHADYQFCRLAFSRLRECRRREECWRSEQKGATKYSVALITPLTIQSFDFH